MVNVRGEGVNGIKILAIGPAGARGGGEKVGTEGDSKEFII